MADVIDVLLRMRGTRQFVAEAGAAEKSISGIGAAEKGAMADSKKATAQRLKGRQALDKVSRSAGILALGVGALGAISYKSAAEFERSLSVFGAVAGVAQKDLKGAREEAIRLGNDAKLPSVTARDAADAMVELAKGGFEAEESLKAARGVLLLSQAAQMDAATSTTILARTLKSFGLDADQSERVVNTMAAASLKSTVGLREIADGMSYASGTAKMMGISVEDTTASLAMLNDAGQVGAKAGASFQIMMSRFTKLTPAAEKTLKKLGIITKEGNNRFYDAEGRFIGMHKAADLLTNALKGTTDQQRLQYLTTIFNQRGMRAANILLGQGSAEYDKYRKAVDKAGAAEKLAGAQAQGSAGIIEQLRNAWQTLNIQLGETLAPAINAVLKPLTKILTIMGKYPKVTTTVILLVGGLAAALWTLNAALKVATLMKELYQAYKLQIVVTKIWTVVQWLLNASLYGFPVIWLIAGIIALGVVFVILYKKVGWFRKAVQATWGWIKRNWPLLLAVLVGPFAIAVVLIIRHWDKVKKAIKSVVDFVIRQVNRIRDLPGLGKLESLAEKAKGLGGKGLLQRGIPHMQTGGTVSRGGSVMVGERGPEIVRLPSAATVQPISMSGKAFGSATIPVQVVLNKRVIAETTAEYTADKVARR